MNTHNFPFLIIFLLFSLIYSCTKQQNTAKSETPTKDYSLPEIPIMLTDSVEITNYIALHYWDKYDFTDTTLIRKSGTGEEIFINYIGLLQKTPVDIAVSGVKIMMQKAQADSSVFAHFMTLSERYFYDPTSPTRNDELFIPILEVFVNSKLIDDSHKIRPLYQLKMALKNRIGKKTSDINLMLTDGNQQRLYQIKALYTLLIFYNPSCHTCQEVLSKMKESDLINNEISNNTLKITAIYTDSDKEEWLKYKSNIPETWINGWDKWQQINKDKKYDLKASPTLYLLDKNKKIILKDAQIEVIIDYLSLK